MSDADEWVDDALTGEIEQHFPTTDPDDEPDTGGTGSLR